MWTIESWYLSARENARKNADQIRKMANFRLGTYREKLPDMPLDELTRTLQDSWRRRIDAVPSLTRYPELRGMRDLILAQRRGIQEGAGLSDLEAAIDADGYFFYHREICCGRVKPKANCSVVFFPRSDHGPLLASNLDTTIDEPYQPPQWPAINEHFVAGGVSSGVFLDEQSPEIFPAPVWTLAGRYCRNTSEAVELFTRYNHFWGPGNMLLADRQNDVAMFEKTACRVAVRRSKDGFGFVTAMTQEDPELWAFVNQRRIESLAERGLPNPCNDTRYWALQDKRRILMNRLMDEARHNPTVEKLRSIMQYREKDGMVAGNGDVLFPGDAPIEHTIKTQIHCLAEGRSLWWARDNQREIPSWLNRKEDIQQKDVFLWN